MPPAIAIAIASPRRHLLRVLTSSGPQPLPLQELSPNSLARSLRPSIFGRPSDAATLSKSLPSSFFHFVRFVSGCRRQPFIYPYSPSNGALEGGSSETFCLRQLKNRLRHHLSLDLVDLTVFIASRHHHRHRPGRHLLRILARSGPRPLISFKNDFRTHFQLLGHFDLATHSVRPLPFYSRD